MGNKQLRMKNTEQLQACCRLTKPVLNSVLKWGKTIHTSHHCHSETRGLFPIKIVLTQLQDTT